MRTRPATTLLLGACLFTLIATTARADLYKANEALAAKDLPKAFELYRELAQIGQPDAQGYLAVMYSNGEGVPRNNLLGYAWATIARENGVTTVQPIIDQVRPHLNDAARARVAEVVSLYGSDALQRTLLPVERVAVKTPKESRCRLRTSPNAQSFYPMEAQRARISGSVLMEARVTADGITRAPLAWFSIPDGVFEVAGRAVALRNRYYPKVENGVAVPCSVVFLVKFNAKESDINADLSLFSGDEPTRRRPRPLTEQQREVASELRRKAVAGDPSSQLAYGVTLITRSELRPEDEKPVLWLLKAAQAGLPAAQYLVGALLMASTTVETDPRKGTLWLEMAANGGNAAAGTMLARYLLGTQRDAVSHEQGLAWLERAAQANHLEGMFVLAALLATSPEAGQRDPARAMKLLEQVGDLFEYDPTLFEIRAAAQAGLGKFQDAQASQARAIKDAKVLAWDTAALEMRLALYQQKRQFSGALIEF